MTAACRLATVSWCHDAMPVSSSLLLHGDLFARGRADFGKLRALDSSWPNGISSQFNPNSRCEAGYWLGALDIFWCNFMSPKSLCTCYVTALIPQHKLRSTDVPKASEGIRRPKVCDVVVMAVPPCIICICLSSVLGGLTRKRRRLSSGHSWLWKARSTWYTMI